MKPMKEQTKITQWGNSKAVRIPDNVVEQLNLKNDDELSVTIENGAIVLTPLAKKPTNIHELFDGWIDDGVRDAEVDWGAPMGNEFRE
ncbi:PbsX family transcriptional regulator [Secundilactobacillus pentosiphilus]|uniref:PbsX family transcriptional regulator n=1 Tax=Secundilactobacillus pentosiphilus TaxID=1714682 RepID=A0A1Z5IZL7_9LACO|nr:AbrB/MazE/SpoVT family DNA-binding domain-containing protein [Secundilactobacillus pentosiphilus]GAX07109.1 PbsX family transcriptional regulator [Secundilactobacillus pentosiphilus]